MSEEQELDEQEKRLLKDRSGYRPDSTQYAGYTAELNKLQRRRDQIRGTHERKDKWKMFGLSQIIPLIALGISIMALLRSCHA